MKNVLKSPKTYMVAGLVIITITASAWQLQTKKQHHDTTTANNYADGDTTKPRKHGIDKDDYGMRDDNINIDINLDGLDTTINNAVREAVGSINVNEIVNEALRSVKEIDWNEINRTINQSLKEAQQQIKNIDVDKINLEIKKAIDEVNTREIRDALDSARLKEIINNALRNVKISIDGQRRL